MFQLSVICWMLLLKFNSAFSASINVDNSKTYALYNTYQLSPKGDYIYGYELDTGQYITVYGKLKNVNGVQVYVVEGSYSYQGEDGKEYKGHFIADENGYRPTVETLDDTSPFFRYYSCEYEDEDEEEEEEKEEEPSSDDFRRVRRCAVPGDPPVLPYSEDDINPKALAGAFG